MKCNLYEFVFPNKLFFFPKHLQFFPIQKEKHGRLKQYNTCILWHLKDCWSVHFSKCWIFYWLFKNYIENCSFIKVSIIIFHISLFFQSFCKQKFESGQDQVFWLWYGLHFSRSDSIFNIFFTCEAASVLVNCIILEYLKKNCLGNSQT